MSVSENLKAYRTKNGYTQHGLAVSSRISIRTIQRIEKGLSTGSPYTLGRLASALNIQVEELYHNRKNGKSRDRSLDLARQMNLSALSVLFIPFGNLICPAIVFLFRHKLNHSEKYARTILSFQLLWSVSTIFLMFFSSVLLYWLFQNLMGLRIPLFLPVYLFSVFANVAVSIWIGIGLNQNRFPLQFVPELV